MTQYIARVENQGYTWMLKGTTWTSSIERADKFSSTHDAQQALQRAKRFTKPALFKRVEIITV